MYCTVRRKRDVMHVDYLKRYDVMQDDHTSRNIEKNFEWKFIKEKSIFFKDILSNQLKRTFSFMFVWPK